MAIYGSSTYTSISRYKQEENKESGEKNTYLKMKDKFAKGSENNLEQNKLKWLTLTLQISGDILSMGVMARDKLCGKKARKQAKE